jgi:mannose-6-phosphate isomerase-like protein (cupin superfamily)
MTPESLTEKFALIHEHWRPKVVAKLNGQEVKLAKLCGVFPWHHHEHKDEMFFVWRGRMEIESREHMVELGAGEPRANTRAALSVPHSGKQKGERFVAPPRKTRGFVSQHRGN